MSKNNKAKLKKAKKGMSPEARRNLGNSFKSLISNQACVDGGKEAPWWIAVIFLVLGICLPVIPITTNFNKTYGSSLIDSYNYGTDRGLAITSQEFKDDKYSFIIKDDNLLHFYKDGDEAAATTEIAKNGSVMKSDIYYDESTGKSIYNFKLFITNYTGIQLNDFVTALTNAKYLNGTLTEFTGEVTDENKDKIYTPSFMVLAPNTLFMAVYKYQSTTKVGTTNAGLDWTRSEKDNLLERVLTTKEESTTESQKINDVFKNWKLVLDESYLHTKGAQMRNTSLLYLGVYAGLVFFLGLMLFLLTRGKNNPFHYLNLWVTEKIAWWACFTPGLLGMILGFLMAGNMIGQMGFIILVSLRVMWLSMRQLRPM